MDALYSVMQGLESRLGGGEGVEGIYGSITATGMHKVLECLRLNCDLRESSVMVDIGAGLGRPLLHALLLHNVAQGYGVELDSVKVAKADAFCKGVLEELANRGIISNQPQQQQPQLQDVTDPADQCTQHATATSEQQSGDKCNTAASQASTTAVPAASMSISTATAVTDSCNSSGRVRPGTGKAGRRAAGGKAAKGSLRPPQSTPIMTCASIEQIASLEPATHAYSFWEGVPLSGKQAFGRLFRAARSLKAVAVVQRAIRGEKPEAYMRGLGFGPLQLIAAFPVNMSGSGRSFQAYVFSKTQSPLELLRQHGNTGKAAAAELASDQAHEAAAISPVRGVVQLNAAAAAAAGASCTKPQRGQRRFLAAAAAAGDGGSSSSDGDESDAGDSDLENQDPAAAAAGVGRGVKLVPLLTHELIRQQQQQQQSPHKRGGDGAVAAVGGGDHETSPTKKQRGVVHDKEQQQQGDHLAAAPTAAAASGYGLRRRLPLGSSSSSVMASSSAKSSSAGGGSSRPRRAAAATAAGAAAAKQRQGQQQQEGKGAAGVSISAGTAATGNSKRSTAGSSNSRGSRSTAVSGCSRARSKTAATAAAAADLNTAAAGEAVVKGSRAGRNGVRGKLQQQQQAVSVDAAVSEARAAVSALGF